MAQSGFKHRIPEFVREVNRCVDRNVHAASLFLSGVMIRKLGTGDQPKIGTGRHRSSITVAKQKDLEYFVGSTIQPRAGQRRSYPLYQELGFRHWKSKKKIQHPWARPSLASAKGTMVRIIGRRCTK